MREAIWGELWGSYIWGLYGGAMKRAMGGSYMGGFMWGLYEGAI